MKRAYASFSMQSKKQKPIIDSSNKHIVNLLCDRSEPKISDFAQKFFEPGCGCGNILDEVLSRRLRKISTHPRKALTALANIYGLDTDINKINIARRRLYNIMKAYLAELVRVDYRLLPTVANIIERNVIVEDFLAQPSSIVFFDWQITDDIMAIPERFTLDELLKRGNIEN